MYSGAAQLRCSLQWQQPFLELVLVCMKSQKAAHEDLLGPLKQQLITFLAAHEKVKLRCKTFGFFVCYS